MRAPILSEYDPVTLAEGSIDPLGLQSGYERLADRLLPAVTVRMSRPRYLTAMAVAAHICTGREEDETASDGVTPPWLVFEWLVVEAFVRSREKLSDARNIPGIQKVERAIRNGRPVSADAYLQTPTVFGYSGIFRRLARATQVLTAEGALDSAGYELLKEWSLDQGLDGFLDARPGDAEGANWRDTLRKVLDKSLKEGHTVPQSRDFWSTLAARLEPGRIGKRERSILLRLIRHRSGEPALVDELVDGLRARHSTLQYADEAKYMRGLRPKGSPAMREILEAIDAYEAVCRPLTDAFDYVRHLSTTASGAPIGPDDFSKAAGPTLVTSFREGLAKAGADEALNNWLPWLTGVLHRFQLVNQPEALFDAVLDHHESVQSNKPPDGKRSWFERLRGKVIVRPAYSLKERPEPRSPYVHEYRLPTFSRFLADLGAL